MMYKKLAAFFSIMAVTVFLVTWGVCKVQLKPVMEAKSAWLCAIAVVFVAWIVGIFLSRLGVNLIQEVISGRRTRDDDARQRAKARYDSIIEGGEHPEPGEHVSAEESGE